LKGNLLDLASKYVPLLEPILEESLQLAINQITHDFAAEEVEELSIIEGHISHMNRYSEILDPNEKAILNTMRAERQALKMKIEEVRSRNSDFKGRWREIAKSIEIALRKARRLGTDVEKLAAYMESPMMQIRGNLDADQANIIEHAYRLNVRLLKESAHGLGSPYKGKELLGQKLDSPNSPSAAVELPAPAEMEFNERDAVIVEKALSFQFDNFDDHRLNLQAQQLSLMTGFETLMCLPLLTDLVHYPHQINTAKQVLRAMRGRALLCDEVGLGKTVEAGLILKEYIVRSLARKVLILVPAALVSQWDEELREKFGVECVVHASPEFRALGRDAWNKCDRVIASLATAKSAANAEDIRKIGYDIVIVDEAHHCRNSHTVNWKLVNSIKSKYLLLLTATPVQNNLDELFNLITLLSPGQLHTIAGFRREFVDKHDPRKPKNQDKLRELMMDVMVRNTRSQVNVALPQRSAYTVQIALTQQERQLYNSVSEFIRTLTKEGGQGRMIGQTLLAQAGSSVRALRATLSLLQKKHVRHSDALRELDKLACRLPIGSKTNALVDLIRKGEDKMIVFTAFLETQNELLRTLEAAGIDAAHINGGMSASQKDQQIELFRREARVLLSTEVGSEGRNLQFCHMLVNFDIPWNPMRIEQRVGRVHRIGQTEPVQIVNFAASGTIEDYILEVLDSKINMFELVIGEIGEILGSLHQEKEFDEIVFDIWAGARSDNAVAAGFAKLSEDVLAARAEYQNVKDYDEALFGVDFVAEE
jgi:SNF2 family DNA or RNA helicase